jgi:hypothetical protein
MLLTLQLGKCSNNLPFCDGMERNVEVSKVFYILTDCTRCQESLLYRNQKYGEFSTAHVLTSGTREKNFLSAFHIFRVRPRVFLEVLERKFANFAVAAKSDAKGILDESCACAERVDCTGELALLAINTHTNSPSCAMCLCCVYTNKLRIFATGTSQPLRRKELI